MKIEQDFFLQPAYDVAPKLLGKFLCFKNDELINRYMITETEAYYGEADTACHAKSGKTKRTAMMYEKGGVAYIYLCYGIHSLLNVVTGPENHPEAVLIRSVENLKGPGKLTKAIGINISMNGTSFLQSKVLWIEKENQNYGYISTPRIGIDYATDEYRLKLWRFVLTQ